MCESTPALRLEVAAENLTERAHALATAEHDWRSHGSPALHGCYVSGSAQRYLAAKLAYGKAQDRVFELAAQLD